MNNNQPQQNGYQQPYQQPQQPGYQQGYQQPQQPGYQQPYYPPKQPKDFSKLIGKVTGLLIYVFLGLAAISVVYGLIMTIVCAASDSVAFSAASDWATYKGGAFGQLVIGCAWTISLAAKYLFFAGVIAGINKLAKK